MNRAYVVEEVCEDGKVRTRAERTESAAYGGLRRGSVVSEFDFVKVGQGEFAGMEPKLEARNEIL